MHQSIKWSNTQQQQTATADVSFESAWSFCGVGA